jgi:type IV fimbrial biogenesis protein FimT
MRAGKRRGQRGFTLMELMLTLTLAAVVGTWSAQVLHEWFTGMRVVAAGNHFLGMLESTRYRSLAVPGKITLCGTPDGRRCDKNLGRRLVIFRDDNDNGTLDEKELQLGQDEFLASGDFWLVWRSFQNKDYLRWAGGRTDSMNGTFTLCNRQHKDQWLRQIVVNRVGRSRSVVPLQAGTASLQAARQACGW